MQSDLSDPFNRSHLTKEMLIPCNDLKEKIEEYKTLKIKTKMLNLNIWLKFYVFYLIYVGYISNYC